ncbi:helix-turn-helix transcriptional regulator [Amycolatopsis sp. EV170708-02-1]|uniref:helix-turn-helix domain-containing protein n=1 Tax=Amycolatopsis sp. EV170708-02-1 TaxID=2919322 RepID=UPI001F0B7E45|nr:helix-turn-helix transcriptional regulator [Amycolatopsis sp. EV170708-02-1]UMP06698.1 helix-turn-helix domain-containing protein [Amycolatopsis sp. EV170708-02-1]
MARAELDLRKRSIVFKSAPKQPTQPRHVEESTAKSRELGAALRRARKHADLTQAEICGSTGWGAPKVSRIESGQREGSLLDIVTYLAKATTEPANFDRLKKLAESPPNGYDLQRHPENMPDLLPTFDFLHTSAKTTTFYEPRRIPSLLQSEQYADVMLRQNRNPKDPLVKKALQARLSRQEVLKGVKAGFDATFYIDEVALHDPTMRSVLDEQLLQLTITSTVPHCHVHIVPSDCIDEDLQTAFGFFEDYDDNSVLAVHTVTAMLVLEDAEDMAPYRRRLSELRETALSEKESAEMINSAMRT